MMEGHQETVVIQDVKAPVFKALLHFAYTDALPEDLEGACALGFWASCLLPSCSCLPAA